MVNRRVKLSPTARELTAGFDRIRQEMQLPTAFPMEVEAEAAEVARTPLAGEGYTDARAIEFVTIDPDGSRDLDQAFHAERNGENYVVHYAIADVTALVAPGSALDREARGRGQTLYCPDERIRLYPAAISEGVGSLLPQQDRPAVLWTFRLDDAGRSISVNVQRALVRSRQQLTYEGTQAAIDRGDALPSLALLKEIGQLRQELEKQRGAVSLEVPEQEVLKKDSSFRLSYRTPLPVEGWNAQISLLTGMAAADIMLRGGVGLLRTMPPPEEAVVRKLQRSAAALGVAWPSSTTYPDFIRALDPRRPAHVALLTSTTQLFRGVTYVAFSGEAPQYTLHHAIAAPYAHVTAPLRRVADRFVNEVVLSLASGNEPPEWCVGALTRLPEEMKKSDHRADELERRIIDFVEAAFLADRCGDVFDAVVVELHKRGATVQVVEPAVLAPCDGQDLALGSTVRVRLNESDPTKGRIRFEVEGPSDELRPRRGGDLDKGYDVDLEVTPPLYESMVVDGARLSLQSREAHVFLSSTMAPISSNG
jgi:exoribonuclease R